MKFVHYEAFEMARKAVDQEIEKFKRMMAAYPEVDNCAPTVTRSTRKRQRSSSAQRAKQSI